MTTTRVGTLQHRVTFQSVTDKDDFDTVNPVQTWTDVATVYASLRPKSSREAVQGEHQQQNTTHECVIRYRSTINDQQRFLHGNRIYHITGIRQLDQRLRFLVIDCIDTGEDVS